MCQLYVLVNSLFLIQKLLLFQIHMISWRKLHLKEADLITSRMKCDFVALRCISYFFALLGLLNKHEFSANEFWTFLPILIMNIFLIMHLWDN